MKILRRLFRAAFRHSVEDRELDDELQFHVDQEIQKQLAAGLPAPEARRVALRALGGVAQAKEACRDALRLSVFDLIEVRALLRMMWRNRLSSAAAVLMLGVAIAGTTTTFALADAALWRALPYARADQLTVLVTRHINGDANVSIPDFLSARQQADGVQIAAAGASTPEYALTGVGDPRQLRGRVLTADYFHTLGVPLLRGRDFTREEEKVGAGMVVIITDRLWDQLFGRREILGAALALNGRTYSIVGIVLPYRDPFGDVDLYVPEQFAPTLPRRFRMLTPVARLASSSALPEFQAELKRVTATPDPEASGYTVDAVPLGIYLGNPLRSPTVLLFGGAVALLGIGFLNFAMLMAARVRQRASEFSIRVALGGSTGRIVRLATMEAAALSLSGTALALLFSRSLIPIVQRQFGALLVNDVTVDVSALLFGMAMAVVAVLVSVIASIRGLNAATRSERRIVTSRLAAGRLLVIAQVATSMVLVISASMLANSFLQLRRTSPGFRVEGLYGSRIALPTGRYASAARRAQFWRALTDGLVAHGVKAAAITSELPLSGEDNPTSFTARLANGSSVATKLRAVSPGFFDAMQIPLREGRPLARTDMAAAPMVVVVNERLAALLSQFGPPLGQTLKFDLVDPPLVMRVVGIVGNIRHKHLGIAPTPEAYSPFEQAPQLRSSLVMQIDRSSGDVSAILKSTLAEIDRDQPFSAPQAMETYVQRSLAATEFQARVLSLFAAGGLVIAAFGLYALLTYLVSGSRKEWALRLALGATGRDLQRRIFRQAATYAVLGVVVGLGVYAGASQVLSAVTYGVSVWNPLFMTAAALTMILVCVLSALIPASRVSRIAPSEALAE